MARPLRVEVAGGRYHVSSRGNQRRPIFLDNGDRAGFLEVVAELRERFGTRVHAYVLMNNHFHLLLETPEANLSRTMQWLNVTWTTRFNLRHEQSGHLLQGRFKSILIEDDAGVQAVGRYLHLNPVRVKGLGLGKSERSAQRAGVSDRLSPEIIRARLDTLRNYRWSSYRFYAGYAAAPDWLWAEELGRLCGGRSLRERQRALRAYTEAAVREGELASPWETLVGGVVLGTAEYARQVMASVRGDGREQKALRAAQRRAGWEEIVSAVEAEKGERWEEFRDRYGDWGRDVALWLGRTAGRLRLTELGEQAGGIDYTAVSAAARRVHRRRGEDRAFRALLDRVQARLSNS